MNTTPLRVLVVDDDADVRLLHRTVLAQVATVVEVADAYQALDALGSETFDAIVTDLYMPGARGSDLVVRLRGRGIETPVIVVTAGGVDALRSDPAGSLVEAVLAKPVSTGDLLRAVCTAGAHADGSHDTTEIDQSPLVIGLRRQSAIAANLAEGVALIRATDGSIVYTNAAFDRLFGYPRGELLGSNVAVLNAPGDLTPQERAADVIAALEAERSWSGEIENLRGDGSHFWCEVDVSSFDDSEHGPVWVSVHRDTTARRAAEDALQMSERKLRAVFERSPLGLALIDHRLRITAANPSFCSLLGYSEEELVDKSLDLLTPPEDVKRDSALISDLLSRRSGEFSVEKRYMSSAGRPLWVEVSGAVVPGVPGVSGDQVLVMVEDIRERKAAEERLSFMGSHDGFTGALNRTTVSATIGQALARAQRTGDYLGVALVDLDNFEKVNRQHGHRTGDELLLAVAHGLEASLRSGDSFARVGSDEFAACYERLGSSLQEAEAVARALASRLLEAVDRSATANGLEIGCSIGIVLTRSRDRGPEELLAATEAALDLVKGRGGGGVQISCDDAPSPLVET